MNQKFVGKNRERLPNEMQPKRYSQVLWSRDKFILSEQDFESNFSETEGTLSSSSWGFDEYEVRSTEKITTSLNAIEDALYDDAETNSQILSSELKQECQKWSRAFPHLRIKGKSITTKNSFGEDSDLTNRFQEVVRQDEEEEEEGEIILQDGCYDDVSPHLEGSDIHNRTKRQKEQLSAAYIKEKVISRLAEELWQNTILSLEKTRWPGTQARENRRLPPIILEKTSPFKHKSKAKTMKASDIPKLDSILSVSPKVLLPSSDKRTVITRSTKSPDQIKPMPSDLVTSPKYLDRPSRQIQSSGIPLHVKISRVRKSVGQAIEIIPPPLHSIEEIPIYNGLKGTSIELENKDARPRYVSVVSPVFAKPPNFLPPIEDREYSPPNVMQDQPRPISYESRITSGRSFNNPNIYARHLNHISSRPSTSRMSIGMRNSEYKLLDTMKMLSSKRTSIDEKIANSQNLVNLFPTVTTKEVIERKRNSRTDHYSALNRKKI